MATSLELVKKAEDKLGTLYTRMDDDAKRAYLEKYKLKNPRTGREVKGAVHITDNSPAVYLNAVSSWIMGSIWQTAIEGDIPPTQKRLVEKFSNDSWLQADDRLAARGKYKVFPFQSVHVCLRGWIGSRRVWTQDKKTGLIYLDVLNIDMRYCSYEQSLDGYNFVGNRTWRSPDKIKAEYPDVSVSGTQDIEVVDYWDDGKNEVWIAGKLAKAEKHKIGYPPFVIQAAPEGFMLLDRGYIIHEGESIFFLNRDLYESYSQLFSITQTLALQTILPPYQKPTLDQQDKPAPYPDATEASYEVKIGEEYKLIPKPDINMAHRLAYEIMKNAIESGGITNIDLGKQISPMPPSALLITEQTEIRNKILKPRIDTMVNACELSTRMDIDQFIKGDFKVDLGKPGQRVQYTSDQLGDLEKYTVEYKLMSRSRRQEIANMAIASAARGVVSRDTIIRDILVSEDPEGEIAKLDAEEAENLDPVLKFIRAGSKLIDVANSLEDDDEADQKRLEAIILRDSAIALINQRKQPQFQPEQPQTEETKPNNQLMSLMGGLT